MARGRPVSTTLTREFHIHLRLRDGEDDDLIAFLDGLPPRRRAVALKSALRTGGMGKTQTSDADPDDEMLSALDDFLK